MRQDRVSLLSSLAELLNPPPSDPAIVRALGRIAGLVDPLLPATPGFEKKLAEPIRHALAYCEQMVSQLPGPVDVSHPAFASDPLIHALFATANDVDEMLGRSQAVRDFLGEICSWESDHFYALLSACHEQKTRFGMSQRGELLHSDVPQTVLYFSSHTLIEPACQLEISLRGLRCKAFERLLDGFHADLEARRQQRQILRNDLASERSQLGMHSKAGGEEAYAAASRQLNTLDQQLQATADMLMPEQILNALCDYLQHPEKALALMPVSVAVDSLGIVQTASTDDLGVHTLNFQELTGRDGRLHLVMLARIDRNEAREAVDKVRDEQRRLTIL